MQDPRTQQAIDWGITYTPAHVVPGQGAWRCVSVDGPIEWGGRVSTYVDVLGPNGTRVVGLPVCWFWQDDKVIKHVEEKRGEPFGLDFVMNAGGNAYGLEIANGQPTDWVFGFGLPFHKPHHVFKVRFAWVVESEVSTPPTPPPSSAAQAIEAAIKLLEYARGLV